MVSQSGVLVTASRTALQQAERCGIPMIEVEVERAILAGRSRKWTLTGERLDQGLRHVVVSDAVAAIVAKDGRTGGGRQRYRAIRLISLAARGRSRGKRYDGP